MAAPVKNYTFPANGLANRPDFGIESISQTSLEKVVASPALKTLVVFIPVNKLLVKTAAPIVDSDFDHTPIALPPLPPMGKLLITTFSAVYKQKGGIIGLAQTPRQYPPIYITHLVG